jgi:hypothetical protein
MTVPSEFLLHIGANIMKIVLAIGCALLIATSILCGAQNSAAPKSTSPQEQVLIDAEKNLIAAKVKDDEASLRRDITGDFAMVGIDGMLEQGQDAIDNLGDSDLAELSPYDMKVVFPTETTAIVSYDAVVIEKQREDQGPPPRYQHFSSVWVNEAGTWKLSFQQATATHWGDW